MEEIKCPNIFRYDKISFKLETDILKQNHQGLQTSPLG